MPDSQVGNLSGKLGIMPIHWHWVKVIDELQRKVNGSRAEPDIFAGHV